MRIRIQLKIFIWIQIKMSAKNVHPPWQNPRYAPVHMHKILALAQKCRRTFKISRQFG